MHVRSWRGAVAVAFVFRSGPMSGCRACWLDVADLLVSPPCVDAFAQGLLLGGPSWPIRGSYLLMGGTFTAARLDCAFDWT